MYNVGAWQPDPEAYIAMRAAMSAAFLNRDYSPKMEAFRKSDEITENHLLFGQPTPTSEYLSADALIESMEEENDKRGIAQFDLKEEWKNCGQENSSLSEGETRFMPALMATLGNRLAEHDGKQSDKIHRVVTDGEGRGKKVSGKVVTKTSSSSSSSSSSSKSNKRKRGRRGRQQSDEYGYYDLDLRILGTRKKDDGGTGVHKKATTGMLEIPELQKMLDGVVRQSEEVSILSDAVVAVIIVRIVFYRSFLVYCLLLNHSFSTNPNRITNCYKLFSLYLYYNFTTTLLLRSLF